MGANGKIMIVFNPTAIRPRPIAVLTDTAGTFPSFSSTAVIPKNIKQFGPGNLLDQVPKNLGIWSTGPCAAGRTLWQYMTQPVDAIFNQLDK